MFAAGTPAPGCFAADDDVGRARASLSPRVFGWFLLAGFSYLWAGNSVRLKILVPVRGRTRATNIAAWLC